jgi:hypothetical protein
VSSKRFGRTLSIAAGAICVVMHLSTFFTVVPVAWLLLPLPLMAGVVLCSEVTGTQRRPGLISTKGMGLVNLLLLVYVVLTYVYVLRANGWTSNVSVLNGQYVAVYRGRVIRTITEHEYRMFPTLWTRAGSAFVGIMASLGLTRLSN